MMRKVCGGVLGTVMILAAVWTSIHAAPLDGFGPGARVLVDAHNCYPERGRYADRIERALSTGLPVAIEQDLVWWKDPKTGTGHSLIAHSEPFTGQEPTLERHFFERIRPLVEQALKENKRADWPVIVLNLDLKSNEPEHHAAI